MAPLQGLPSAHQGLTLARVQTPNGSILAACSVMPWRGARTCWPGDPSAALAIWFPHTLTDHLRQIDEARRAAEPVVWGGDFNQGLTGPEQVGSGPLPGTRPRKSGMADNKPVVSRTCVVRTASPAGAVWGGPGTRGSPGRAHA